MKKLAYLGLATVMFACTENENKQNETAALDEQQIYSEEAPALHEAPLPGDEVTRVSDQPNATYTISEESFLPTAESLQSNISKLSANASLLEAEVQRAVSAYPASEATETNNSSEAAMLDEDAREKLDEANKKIAAAKEKLNEARQKNNEGQFDDAIEDLKDVNEKLAEAEEKYNAALEKETGVELED